MKKQMVTIRVNKDLHEEFTKKCEKQSETATDVIISHMEKQIKKYSKPASNKNEYDTYNYSKLNVRVSEDIYANYKIELIKNRTTPTADILRFIRTYVE